VTLADVKRVSKRLFDPARLTVVIAGSPAENRATPPVGLPPGKPPTGPAPQPRGAASEGVTTPGVISAPKPAGKPLVGKVTTPQAAKKP
jgi:hypothetical protein